MLKRLFLTFVLTCSIVTFYCFIPLDSFRVAPILLSILFSIITVVLIGMVIFNISNYKEWQKLKSRVKSFNFWKVFYSIATLAFGGFFFLYFLQYTDRFEVERISNSEESTGTILRKWTTETRRKFTTYSFTHIRVKYKVGDREVISEHITPNELRNIGEVGENIKIYYSNADPEIFETEWEKERREYDPLKDPEKVRMTKYFDSLIELDQRTRQTNE